MELIRNESDVCHAHLLAVPGDPVAYEKDICPPVGAAAIKEEVVHHLGKDRPVSDERKNEHHCHCHVRDRDHVVKIVFDYEKKHVELSLLYVHTHQSIIHHLEANVEVNKPVPIDDTRCHEGTYGPLS